MSDDELRRRLREIPGPRARIDADAVLAGARRTRRPKVAAVTAAAAGAGVLIIAPFVAPGLQSLQPASAPGSAEDAGAPAAESGGGADTGVATDAPMIATMLADACAAVAATGIGVELRFVDDPADGTAELAVASLLDERATVTVEAAGSAALDASGAPVAVAPGTADAITVFELEPRGSGSTAVEPAPPASCGSGGEIAGTAPLARVTVEHEGETTGAFVVGEAWEGVR